LNLNNLSILDSRFCGNDVIFHIATHSLKRERICF